MRTTQQKSTHGSANKTDNTKSNSNQLVEYKQIPETPFTAARMEDKWFLLLGRYRLTKEGEMKSYNDCAKATKDVSWHRLMQVMHIVSQDAIKQHEIEKQAPVNDPAQTKLKLNQD